MKIDARAKNIICAHYDYVSTDKLTDHRTKTNRGNSGNTIVDEGGHVELQQLHVVGQHVSRRSIRFVSGNEGKLKTDNNKKYSPSLRLVAS